MGRVAARLELKGIPAVMASWDWEHLKVVSRRTFMMEGVPTVREVFTPADPFLDSTAQVIPQFIDALTKPLTDEEKKSGYYKPSQPSRIAMTGTEAEIQKYFRGDNSHFNDTTRHSKWTDGLPIVLPTEERVAEMLKGTSHKPDEIVVPTFNFVHNPFGKPTKGMAPWGQIATVEKVAVNAVMAGCSPEQFPVVLAMTEAGACVGYPGTCSGGHLFIVSGPIAEELGMNSGAQLLVPGNPANMAVARAAVLVGLNVAGARPGDGNMETWGNTMWGLTFAESTDSPWEPMNVSEGFNSSESVLFMIFANKILPICEGDLTTVKGLRYQAVPPPENIVNTLQRAAGHDHGALVMFSPAGAKAFSKRYNFSTSQQLQDYLWDNITRTRGDWESDYFFYMKADNARKNPRGSRMLNPDHLDLPKDALVPRYTGANNIKIAVAGDSEWPGWGWVGFMGQFATSIDKWR
jgi:hypothetical protein